MIWDFAIVYMGVSLAISGWYLGLINSWPVPIAMILATASTQFMYVNFGAVVEDQTRLPGDLAFFVAYVMIWVAFEVIFEMGLLLLLPIKKRYSASIPSRIAGACIGIAKSITVLTFAAAAAASSVSLPSPPKGSAIVGWMCESTHGSLLLRASRSVASHMPMELAHRVVSEGSPIFQPTFRDQTYLNVDQHHAQKWRELFNGLRNLEDEI